MSVGNLVLVLALAAAAPVKKPAAKAEAAKPASKSPQWIGASGLEAGAERASPEGAMLWARLLARENSFAAASRAYENLARRWPGAPGAERALLESRSLAEDENGDPLGRPWAGPCGAGLEDGEGDGERGEEESGLN